MLTEVFIVVWYVPAPKNTCCLDWVLYWICVVVGWYEWCMYDSCVESEKGVPVEVQCWRVRCLAIFNIKKSSLTLKHQKVKSNP